VRQSAETLPVGLRPGGRFTSWRPARPAYVVADVDGTLLGESSSPTRPVLDAIEDAAAAGVRVGFATGRMLAAVKPLWEVTRLPGPHVVHNGALVRADGQTIAAWPLAPDEVRATLEICEEHGWYAEAYIGDGYYVTDARPEAAVHWHMLHQDPEGLTDEVDPGSQRVLKITVAVFDEPPAPVIEKLGSAGLRCGAATSPMAPGVSFVNVTNPEADKGRALTHAAAHVGLDLASVVAVGDGLNDLPMLAVAGTAIAMGQASDEVRDAAHLLVPGVADDGVARALDAVCGWAHAAA
jgi:Cof subfamily protein (haloacid dehalogenase superfamily)